MLKSLALTIVGTASVGSVLLLALYRMLLPYLVILQSSAASITVWQFLQILAPILGPILVVVIVAIGRFVWKNRQQINELKQNRTRHGRTLYGDEKDEMHPGLAEEIADVRNDLDELKRSVNRLCDALDEE